MYSMKGALFFLFSFLSTLYKGTLVHELDVAAPASDMWAVYGTLRMLQITDEMTPGEKTQVLEGDGGVDTVFLVIFPPGYPGPTTYQKEKFVKVDDEHRVKETMITEGGMLGYGFSLYKFRFEIVEKTTDSCTIKSSIEYEIDEEHAANIAFANTGHVAQLAEAVAKYVLEKKTDRQMF